MTCHLFDPGTEDVASLAALHALSFADAWSAAFIRDLFATPGVFAFTVAEGFILARAAGGEAEILTLAVVPSARHRGVGRTLVRAAARRASALGAAALFLEVAADNEAAYGLYRGLGFAPVGRRRGYYAGKDALVLKAALPLPENIA